MIPYRRQQYSTYVFKDINFVSFKEDIIKRECKKTGYIYIYVCILYFIYIYILKN